MKIDFSRKHELGIFKDSIVLPDDHTLSEEEIDAIQEERFQSWVSMMQDNEE